MSERDNDAWAHRTHALLDQSDAPERESILRCARDARDANLPLQDLPAATEPHLRHPLSGATTDKSKDLASLRGGVERLCNALSEPSQGEDPKAHHLRAWRELVTSDDARALPADAALPDHSVAAHRSLTAALAGARREGGRAALLYLHVGPVQSFVEAARRTHDLYAGSFTVAYLTFLAVHAVAQEEGPAAIVYPWLADLPLAHTMIFNQRFEGLDRLKLLRSSLPNKLLAIVPLAQAEALADKAAKAARDGWRDMAGTVHAKLKQLVSRIPEGNIRVTTDPWDQGWQAQINDHLEIDVIVQPWPETRGRVRSLLGQAGTHGAFDSLFGDLQDEDAEERTGAAFGALFDLTHRTMGAHRTTEPGRPASGDQRPKCPQCGLREQMGPMVTSRPAAQQATTRRFFTALSRAHQTTAGSSQGDGSDTRESLQLAQGEGLCAVCLTKRFAAESYFGANRNPFRASWEKVRTDRFLLRYPSTPTIASAPFRRWISRSSGADEARQLAQQLAQEIEHLPLRFDPPGNLLPGLGRLGRDDDLLSLEGWWLYDSAYEPRTAWRNHRAGDPLDDEEKKSYAELQRRLPKLRRKLSAVSKAAGGVRPSTYYAVLVVDGDHMGEWLTGRRKGAPRLGDINPSLPETERDRPRPLAPALHGELSRRLGLLALALYDVVETQHLGRIVYSGGDDLLALLPLATALPCLGAVRTMIQSEEHLGRRFTISAGLGIAHVRAPLRDALQLAREAENDAKNLRDAFAIRVDKRSGTTTNLLLPFALSGDAQQGPIDTIAAMRELLSWKPKKDDAQRTPDTDSREHPLRSVNVAHRLAEEAEILMHLDIKLFRCRLQVLLGAGFSADSAATALLHRGSLTVRQLADILLFTRFLLREEHGLPTETLLGNLTSGLGNAAKEHAS